MLKVHKIPVGPLQTNCYVVSNEQTVRSPTSHSCVVIDPGDEAQKIIEFIESKNLKPTGVVLTHAHFDHTGALEEIKKLTTSQDVNLDIWDLKVIKTPGHSRDSICFVNEKEGIIFSGDTLFNQGIGRTDLEGGDYEQIKKSLEPKQWKYQIDFLNLLVFFVLKKINNSREDMDHRPFTVYPILK